MPVHHLSKQVDDNEMAKAMHVKRSEEGLFNSKSQSHTVTIAKQKSPQIIFFSVKSTTQQEELILGAVFSTYFGF